MNTEINNHQFDVILVGSGTCSSVIAKELSQKNKKVLILEQGKSISLTDSISSFISIAKEFVIGDNLSATTAITTGGATSIYFGVCKLPTADALTELGIDLSVEFEEVKKELPIVELPDEFLPPQSLLFRNSARALGYNVKKNLMLVDQSKCPHGVYEYQSKWRAKTYLDEAVESGAELIANAKVRKIIVKDNMAIGVEYILKSGLMTSRVHQVFAKKIVLGAGVFSTPKLLMDCGVKDVGNRGFFCKPGFMVCGSLAGLHGKNAFVGNLDIDLGNGVSIGDGTMNSSLFQLVMLANLKFRKLFSHANILSVGILLNDSLGGSIKKDGSFHKLITDKESAKLLHAETIARNILEKAGAKNIFKTKLVAGIPGGLLKIGEHLDKNLQTQIVNLYVCDHSVISDVKSTPTVSLVCLAKYLAKHLVASLKELGNDDSCAKPIKNLPDQVLM